MPLPALVTAGIIAGAGSMAATGTQAATSAGRTKAARRWQEGQYNKQRLHFLEDREYNESKNQMARFQEAGLNPHLIYGQGQQAQVQKATMPGTSQQPGINPGKVIGSLNDVMQARIQTGMARKSEAEAEFLEQSLEDRVDSEYLKWSDLLMENNNRERLYNERNKGYETGNTWYKKKVYAENKLNELIAYKAQLRKRFGTTDQDPWYLRYAMSRYSGDSRALGRVLDAAAIAEGLSRNLPKTILGIGKVKRVINPAKKQWNKSF